MSTMNEKNKKIDSSEELADIEKKEGEISDNAAENASGGWGSAKEIVPEERGIIIKRKR